MSCVKPRRFFARVNDLLTRADKAAARGDLRAAARRQRRNGGSRAPRPPRARHCPTAVPFVPTAAVATTILVFDSGLGGLTVFREVVKARPDARYVYVADDAFFPYNSRGETELVAWVGALMG